VLFTSEKLLKTSNSNDFLKFLKNIVIMKPIQNSKPARANKKKDVDVNIRSSLIVPAIDVKLYNTTHMTSE